MKDHFQKQIVSIEELREEISSKKTDAENMNKRIQQYEKDTGYMTGIIQNLQTEVIKFNIFLL